jgi:hypothetical protein
MLSSVVIFVDFPAVSGADLIVGDDESVYIVSGYETWGDVTVLTTGKLIVPSGATLNATNIYTQGTSIVEINAGTVIFYNPTFAGNTRFVGSCSFFNVTNSAEIIMNGSDGYADTTGPGPYHAFIPISMGGDAEVNISVSEGLFIDNSTIILVGGNGFNLPASNSTICNAWAKDIDLDGFTAAGGNATFTLYFTSLIKTFILKNSTINIIGGNGGRSARGGDQFINDAGKGGGYCNGGNISGYVGTGGNATVFLASDFLELIDTNITTSGGKGGKASDGGNSTDTATMGGGAGIGAGGGGYGGGDGNISYGKNGSIVRNNVGAGGSAKIIINSKFLNIERTILQTNGGAGGDAGNGGNGYGYGGGGGGGYGGGGGGGKYVGGKGNVTDYVGSGGWANITILSVDASIIFSGILAYGGKGGMGGDGGECKLWWWRWRWV